MAKDKKEPKQLLTQELMAKLSEDGYCFDPDHAGDIDRLNAEITSLKEALGQKIADASEAAEKVIESIRKELDRATILQWEGKCK